MFVRPWPTLPLKFGPFQIADSVFPEKMSDQRHRVRIVQVGPGDSLLHFHGPSAEEAASRLFDTSERPLSGLAERLLETISEDRRRTQGTVGSASGWWNGQPVDDETRSNAFLSLNNTSTPQKQPHQGGGLPQPQRPSKTAMVNSSFSGALIYHEDPSIINDEVMQESRIDGCSVLGDELRRASFHDQNYVSSSKVLPHSQHHQPFGPREGVTKGVNSLQPQVDSGWLTQSSWVDGHGLQMQPTRSPRQANPPSPSFDVTMEEDQSFSELQLLPRPAGQGTNPMTLNNFSPPSNLLPQFVSKDMEEEGNDVSRTPEVDNVMGKVALPIKSVVLPVPKRKSTFSAPFKRTL